MTDTAAKASAVQEQVPLQNASQKKGGKRGGGRMRKGGRRGNEKKEFEESILQIDRVTRVVKGGRRMRFRVTVIIGNRKGKVGMGIGKSGEVATSVQKAVTQAKKNLVTIPIVNETIPHEVRMKVKSSQFLMMPAVPGTGIIAGGAMRKIADLSGIKNLLAKSFGTNNKILNAQGTMKALLSLRARPELEKKGIKEVTPIAAVEDTTSDKTEKPKKKEKSEAKETPKKTEDSKKSEKEQKKS